MPRDRPSDYASWRGSLYLRELEVDRLVDLDARKHLLGQHDLERPPGRRRSRRSRRIDAAEAHVVRVAAGRRGAHHLHAVAHELVVTQEGRAVHGLRYVHEDRRRLPVARRRRDERGPDVDQRLNRAISADSGRTTLSTAAGREG